MFSNHCQQWKGFILLLILSTQYLTSVARVIHYHRTKNDELDICPVDDSKVCALEKPKEKRLIVAIIFAVSIFVTLANLAFDLYLQIKGCCGIFPDACDYRDKFNDIKEDLEKRANEMNDEYARLTTTLDYIKQTNEENHNIFTEITRIMQLEKRVIETLDAQILEKLRFKRDELRDAVDSHNATVQRWSLLQLSTSWNGVFANAESAAMVLGPVLGTVAIQAIQSGLAWYKGYKIAQAVQAQSSVLSASTKASKIMGVSSAKTYTAQTITAQQKAASSVSAMSKFAKFAGVAMSLVSIGFEIYMAIQKVKACEKVRDGCRDAYNQIKEEPEKFKKTEAEMLEFESNLNKAYDDSKGQVKSETFLGYLLQVNDIAKGADQQSTELQEASKTILSFHANVANVDKAKLISMQKDLYKAFVSVEFTWICFDKKISAVSYVYEHCKKGTNSIEWLFNQASTTYNLDAYKCTSSTGHKYMTFEETQKYVYDRMNNEGYIADCVLNNVDLRYLTCSDYVQDYTNEEIAERKQLTIKQVEQVIKMCEPATVSPLIRNLICALKDENNIEAVKKKFFKYNEEQVVDAYNECPKPKITDDIKFTIAADKYLGLTLSQVLSKFSQYDANDIKSYYPNALLTMTVLQKAHVCLAKQVNVSFDEIYAIYTSFPKAFVKNEIYDKCESA